MGSADEEDVFSMVWASDIYFQCSLFAYIKQNVEKCLRLLGKCLLTFFQSL